MVFLSHSTKDKPLIEEIAFELINEGIDVWLDKWEIENGDILDEKINQGIDNSCFVILFLSRNSLNSTWVQRELNQTLTKESRENKKYLLPVKLNECTLTSELENRLYTDFSASFTQGLSQLVKFLKAKGQNISEAKNPLIPVKINRLLHVDTQALERLFARVIQNVKENKIVRKQILIVQCDQYYNFKKLAYTEFDKNVKTSEINAEHISYFREVLKKIEDIEEMLVDGILEILNQCNRYNEFNLIESVKWFYLSMFYSIGAKMDQLINFKVKEFTGTELMFSPFGSNTNASQFYNVKAVKSFDIWKPSQPNDYIKFWVDEESFISHDHKEFPFIKNFTEVYDSAGWFKYLIPQMVRGNLMNRHLPIWWDFENAKIGAS